VLHEKIPRTLSAFSLAPRVNPKFHPNRRSARRREADVIWRLPLVLYSGAQRWNASTVTSELIALSPDSSLWPWQPQVRYRLLDVGRFPKDELARRSSLVSLLFRLEQPHSPDEHKAIVGELIGWFREHPGYERLRGLFTELIRESCVQLGMSLSGSGNLLEEKTMLVDTFRAWQTQWFAEGKAEGKVEGKAAGKAEALITLLVARFGEVAPSWQERIHGAELVTLEHWFERAIVAPDLPSVFNSPR
jgi:putative YhgA-like transposase